MKNQMTIENYENLGIALKYLARISLTVLVFIRENYDPSSEKYKIAQQLEFEINKLRSIFDDEVLSLGLPEKYGDKKYIDCIFYSMKFPEEWSNLNDLSKALNKILEVKTDEQ